MADQELRNSLTQLRGELTQLGPLDAETQKKVNDLIDQLDSLSEEGNQEEIDPLQELLSDSITSFEVTHPKLTGLMSHLMSLLSSIGI